MFFLRNSEGSDKEVDISVSQLEDIKAPPIPSRVLVLKEQDTDSVEGLYRHREKGRGKRSQSAPDDPTGAMKGVEPQD